MEDYGYIDVIKQVEPRKIEGRFKSVKVGILTFDESVIEPQIDLLALKPGFTAKVTMKGNGFNTSGFTDILPRIEKLTFLTNPGDEKTGFGRVVSIKNRSLTVSSLTSYYRVFVPLVRFAKKQHVSIKLLTENGGAEVHFAAVQNLPDHRDHPYIAIWAHLTNECQCFHTVEQGLQSLMRPATAILPSEVCDGNIQVESLHGEKMDRLKPVVIVDWDGEDSDAESLKQEIRLPRIALANKHTDCNDSSANANWQPGSLKAMIDCLKEFGNDEEISGLEKFLVSETAVTKTVHLSPREAELKTQCLRFLELFRQCAAKGPEVRKLLDGIKEGSVGEAWKLECELKKTI